jgi:hypothetical protein
MAIRVTHGTLTAATVATVTLSAYWKSVEILNRGTTEIYVNTDGTSTPANPTVAGDEFDVIPPNSSLSVSGRAAWSPTDGTTKPTTTVVKLISSATPTYSVIGGY